MKKISRSLVIIAGVAALAIGGTYALFSDTETSTENTITTGTIDIAIDDKNPWEGKYTINDIKPGETKYIEFNVQNVGQNPVNVSKKIYGMVGKGGSETYQCWTENNGSGKTSSEPECDAEKANGGNRKDDIQTQIVYDLSVEVWQNSNKVWWQTIYADSEKKTPPEVYPDENTYVKLGMLPVGATMKVKQSYHLKSDAGNEYQGDELMFNMEIKADQLPQGDEGRATVTLENKSGAPDWNIIEDDINGTLTYKTAGPVFDYSFAGKVGKNNTEYALIYYADPWPGSGTDGSTGMLIGKGSSDGSGNLTISGTKELGTDLPNNKDQNAVSGAKIWVVPSADYNESEHKMQAWNPADYLFDTALITYDDTDI